MTTYKSQFIKKYKVENKGYSLKELSDITGIKKSILQKVYSRGVGAYKTNPQSVRPQVKSKEQWGYGRVYGFIMKNPKQVGKGKPDSDL